MDIFPVCWILRNMSHFYQKILEPICRELDKYEKISVYIDSVKNIKTYRKFFKNELLVFAYD
jgi:hypothetical protein